MLELGSTKYEEGMHHSISYLAMNVRHIRLFIALHRINLLNIKYQN